MTSIKDYKLLILLIVSCPIIFIGSWAAMAEGYFGIAIGGFVSIIVEVLLTFVVMNKKVKQK